MKYLNKIRPFLLMGLLFSCDTEERADGYGNFEAREITVSSEANGKIQALNLEEGDLLEQDAMVGLVDTLQLYFTKQQLVASKTSISSKSKNILSQIGVLDEQLKTITKDQKRVQEMFDEKAATQRQLDEINGKVNVLQEQIKSVKTQNAPIINELDAIDIQIQKTEDQIQKSKITNPLKGTVLVKYAEPSEVITFGRPIYKIADLEEMTLRVFVSERQLPQIKIGQEVTVKVDSTSDMKTYTGDIIWISPSAEFTPKIIQTKEERVNLVYAVKIRIKNDGGLKIGMPGEMWIN